MANASPRICAIVPAAGAGSRMQSSIPKQYLNLSGRTVLERTLERLDQARLVQQIFLVTASDDLYLAEQEFNINTSITRVDGGQERCHSVLNGLRKAREFFTEQDWVLVHDAARPCVRVADIKLLVEQVLKHSVGGLLGRTVCDTMKRTAANQEVTQTVDRSHLWHAFTPQMFRIGQLQQALETALQQGLLVTDESSAMEQAGFKPVVVPGHADNIKITQPEDLALAAFFLEKQRVDMLEDKISGMEDGG